MNNGSKYTVKHLHVHCTCIKDSSLQGKPILIDSLNDPSTKDKIAGRPVPGPNGVTVIKGFHCIILYMYIMLLMYYMCMYANLYTHRH